MKKNRRALLRILAFLVTAGVLLGALILLTGEKTAPAEASSTPETLPPNLLGPEDFHYEGDYLVCSAMEAVMGIDVSYYQGDVDWPAVKAAGVEFVMIRLGRRTASGELGPDERVGEYLAGARAAGLKVGAYFYSQALNVREAREEAALALEILDGFPLDLPLAYDWEQEERTALMDPRTLTDCTLAFCQAVEEAGVKAMIYFNRYQARELLHLGELLEYPWWLAMYDVQAAFPWRMDMWQYTCTGSVPGIEGSVDINLLFDQTLLG